MHYVHSKLLGHTVDLFRSCPEKIMYMWGDHTMPVPYKVRGTIRYLFDIRYGGTIRVM